jgi:hypothetical protein
MKVARDSGGEEERRMGGNGEVGQPFILVLRGFSICQGMTK